MNRLAKYRGWLVGVLLAGLVAGCTQTEPARNTLGNLPDEPLDDTPKVTAMTFFAHGHLLERSGNYERAVVQYRKALRLKPNFVGAHNRLGITLNKLGRHAEASEEFRQAIALRPDEAYLYNNLGFSLYLEKEYDQADEVLKHALELDPDFARARMNHAVVLAELGHYDAAYQELLKVGGRADACYNMGLMLTEGKRYKEAAQYLEAALAVRPDFDAARRQLREVGRLAAEAEALRAAKFAKNSHSAATPTVAAGAADGPRTAHVSAGGTKTTSGTGGTATSTGSTTNGGGATVTSGRTAKATGGNATTHSRRSRPQARVAATAAGQGHVATHATQAGKHTAQAPRPSATARHTRSTSPTRATKPAAKRVSRTASAGHVTDADLLAIERLFERGRTPATVDPDESYNGDVLAALILQALDAIEHHAADADELWCEMSEYVTSAMWGGRHGTLAK